VEKNVIDILSQTLKIRKNNNLVHHDFLHVMNQIQENSKSVEFTEVDVTTHALDFSGTTTKRARLDAALTISF
jgi:hypothetical protein